MARITFTWSRTARLAARRSIDERGPIPISIPKIERGE